MNPSAVGDSFEFFAILFSLDEFRIDVTEIDTSYDAVNGTES